MDELKIRSSGPQDARAITDLYPDAFPDEDLVPLVRELLVEDAGVLSLVALTGNLLTGHIVFTDCGISGKTTKASLLEPLAVASVAQRQGIGSALIRAGLQHLENSGIEVVCVLGDPAYYGRFSFSPENRIAPPYPLPEEWLGAWQSMALGQKAVPPEGKLPEGKLTVPQPWRRRELWLP